MPSPCSTSTVHCAKSRRRQVTTVPMCCVSWCSPTVVGRAEWTLLTTSERWRSCRMVARLRKVRRNFIIIIIIFFKSYVFIPSLLNITYSSSSILLRTCWSNFHHVSQAKLNFPFSDEPSIEDANDTTSSSSDSSFVDDEDTDSVGIEEEIEPQLAEQPQMIKIDF